MEACLCLGANLGEPEAQIKSALNILDDDPRIRITKRSSLIITKPYGKKDQPDFLNQIVQVETDYSPLELLSRMQFIEEQMGRVRKEKWGPRVIDIDILLCGDQILHTEELTIPHYDLQNRRFVLELLCELDQDMQHPIYHKSISELLRELDALEDTK